MALLYDPGTFMPHSTADVAGSSWMLTWDSGPWHLHDLEPGGTVFLVRAGNIQRIVWETRVTHSFAVPYEGVADLAMEVLSRWGLVIETPKMNPGGFCIGWRAEPVARLDRTPCPLPEHLSPDDGEVLDLDGFQQSALMTEAFRHRWSLPADPDVLCAGRSPIGWFGPPSTPSPTTGSSR